MSIRIRWPIISSFFLLLSCGSFAIFLSPISSHPTSRSCVPLVLLSLNEVLHNFTWGNPGQRRSLLKLLPLHPPLLLRLQQVKWHLRPSWHNLCAWMLALTLSVMSCVRWTPVLVVSHNDRLSWVVSLWLPLHLHQHLRIRVTMAPAMMMLMRMMMMARLVMMRCLLDILTNLSLVTKRGSSFEMRVVILIGGGLV